MLTVGEAPDFIEPGGIVSFFLDDGNVRFEINQAGGRTRAAAHQLAAAATGARPRTQRTTEVRFRDLPIRRKLLLMTLAPSATARRAGQRRLPRLGHRPDPRREIAQDVGAQARSLAENSRRGAVVPATRAARETRSRCSASARGSSWPVSTTADDAPFATYRRDGHGRLPADAAASRASAGRRWNGPSPVIVDGRQVGTLFIRRELSDVAATAARRRR